VEIDLDSERRASGEVVPVVDPERRSRTESFFPARNENELFFKIRIPRFGLRFENRDPVLNSSEITRIPPFYSIYHLDKKVRFHSRSWLPIPIDVVSCIIETMIEESLGLRVDNVAQVGRRLDVDFTLNNSTTADRVLVVWSLTGPDGTEASPKYGRVKMKRSEIQARASLNVGPRTGPLELCLRAGVLNPFGVKGAAAVPITFDVA
jgi:hypothetical protein